MTEEKSIVERSTKTFDLSNKEVSAGLLQLERQLMDEFWQHKMGDPNATKESLMLALSSNQARLLSEIQVKVDIQVGQLQMSAEKLIDLLPGQVFDYEFDSTKPVKINIGDEEIANARFVLNEGELALEILSVGKE